MRKKKKPMKNIPRMTIFERSNALSCGEVIKQGFDPRKVRRIDMGGEYLYTYKDIAHFFEIIKKPFSADITYSKEEGK